MRKLFAAALLVSALLRVYSGNRNWSYHKPNGPGTWKKHYPSCGGIHQSPINIVPKQTIFDTGLEDFSLDYEAVISVELENNGHSVQATFLTGRSNISGGGLPSSFQAVQMHFHWGSKNSRGSEHQIQGTSFPLEIHIVHYNVDKYANFTVAMKKDDGLAVLGILVEIQDKDNPIWNVVVNNLNKTLFKGEKTILKSLKPLSFLPEVWTQYFAYRGSLTTPGCFESVHWIVFNNSVSISKAQLAKFRQLYDADRQSTEKTHLVDNFRPIQSLNERPITRSFQRPLFPCDKISQVAMMCSVLAGDKIVFYNVTVDICTVPVTLTLQVSQPDVNYNFVEIVYQDIKQPREIGNLRYGFVLEMHSHYRQTDSGYLHITVNQVHPLSTPNQREVISKNFYYTSCQLGKCTADGNNKHWCDGTTIGFGNDTLNIGFSTNIDYASSGSPLAVIEFYRNESGSWHLSDKKTFGNDEIKKIHLTETLVQGSDSELPTRNRRMIESSRWEYVNFTAMIRKSSDYVVLQLFMAIPSNGLYYKVLKDKHPLPPGNVHSKRLSDGSKIAIGVSVVLVVVVLVGVTLGILYRKRKQYVGHRPALVQQMDTQDDVITDNVL